jgi:hypothetical protein
MPEEIVACPHCGAQTIRSETITACAHCGGSLSGRGRSAPPRDPEEFTVVPLPPIAEQPVAQREAPEPESAAPEPDVAPLPALVPPPRRVPLSLRLTLIFGGVLGLFGWVFALFGSTFAVAFVPSSDLRGIVLSHRETRTVYGRVTSVETTNCSENGGTVYAHHYSFVTENGARVEGTSYRVGALLESDRLVPVQYVPSNPRLSRIEGMRTRPFSVMVLFVLVFPLIGYAFAFAQWRAGSRAIRLLRSGLLAYGKLARTEATNVSVNNRPVLRMTFDFEAQDGASHLATARSSTPECLTDSRRELLLYLPERPESAVLLDSLPTSPSLTEAGEWAAVATRRAFVAVVMPLASLLCLGLVVWLVLR